MGITHQVIGLDLSLQSTGIAVPTETFRVITETKHGDVIDRARLIGNVVLRTVEEYKPTVAVLEAPSFGSLGGKPHERGYLWWRVREALYDVGLDTHLLVSPSTLKKYATGNGHAGKDDMVLATARQFPWFTGKNDEADALWACVMGYEWLRDPLFDLPKVNRSVLAKWLASAPSAA